jgi:hypothetical protein
MPYYLNLFSPETYEAFSKSAQNISGFRIRQINAASKVHPGDKFLCYMTKLSRWVGILEVLSESFVDQTPFYYAEGDPFVVRFQVRPVAWLAREKAVPIHEDRVWNALTITRGHPKHSAAWTGRFRSSLSLLDEADGQFLERLMLAQAGDGQLYPVDEKKYQKLVAQRIRRLDKVVAVSVPEDSETEAEAAPDEHTVRDSIKIQAVLAKIGEKMGFKVWIPRQDRAGVLKEWQPEKQTLLDELPLNYDLTTLRTIEQIDVLWLKQRSIVRAFEVEHSTAIYSGILRMADLLSLQPNMDIKLHLVAPAARRDKVFQEIQRPVFSLLEKGPLAELCTFIAYDSVLELSKLKHLAYLSDGVLEEYEEVAE